MTDRKPNRPTDPDGADWLDELFSPTRSGRSGVPVCEEPPACPVTDTCAYLARELIEQYADPSG